MRIKLYILREFLKSAAIAGIAVSLAEVLPATATAMGDDRQDAGMEFSGYRVVAALNTAFITYKAAITDK